MNKVDVVTMTVAPIFLAVMIGLTIYYSLHPSSPVIRMSSNFSMSQNLLVFSSSGAVLTFVMAIQLLRRSKVKDSFKKLLVLSTIKLGCSSKRLQKFVRYALYPCGRDSKLNEITGHNFWKDLKTLMQFFINFDATTNEGKVSDYLKNHDERIRNAMIKIGYLVPFTTRDNLTLRGYWHYNSEDSPTVIFFYGNAAPIDEAVPNIFLWGLHYKHYWCNILMVDYRGYGTSQGTAGGENQELEAYLDAEAALNFVLGQGVDKEKIIAHGFSLGGAYAAALGYFFDVPLVILSHTFPSYEDAFDHFSPLPKEVSHAAVQASFKKGKIKRHPQIGVRDLVTDGFNTLRKVENMSSQVLIMESRDDSVAASSFGQSLINARYTSEEEREAHHIYLNGDHSDKDYFNFEESVTRKMHNFLINSGIYD